MGVLRVNPDFPLPFVKELETILEHSVYLTSTVVPTFLLSGYVLLSICLKFQTYCLPSRSVYRYNGKGKGKGKGKAIPLQAWSGPEGSRKLRFPDYMTTAQNGGKFVSLIYRSPLPPGNAPGTHFC
jgi:hypothetical protein